MAAENDFGQENQSEKLLVMKSIREDSSGAENEVVDVLRWRPDEKMEDVQILYEGFEKRLHEGYVASEELLEVLADNVVGFNVDISQAGTEGVVHFQLTITKRGETVSQTYTAALRNKVKINSES